MSTIQFIERNGKREYAVVPMELFARLMRAAESLDDVALFDAVKAADDGFRVPGAVAHAILDGTHPVKAWREYRGFTQDALAEKAGISKAYLSQIETGKRTGVAKTLKALASALGVTLNELQP
ncbi:Transcriptional regulator, XRE family [Thiomonas sp. X19]|uniref:helix-turn-helix domain-containing protein n=1 Tax=Thiomonas sp. X19 TaxID=1050370 RepID=UPI000B635D29|nr:helix-turn-helix transcriptional regulator [Thiomonas sp. X19]SCC95818.1 Transcriptional regulator, XRE family [Thiomonas sp. X19]